MMRQVVAQLQMTHQHAVSTDDASAGGAVTNDTSACSVDR